MDGARAEFAIEGSVAQSRMNTEAGDGARTHDPQLGKLMLYQLSYAREAGSVAILSATLIPAESARKPAGQVSCHSLRNSKQHALRLCKARRGAFRP